MPITSLCKLETYISSYLAEWIIIEAMCWPIQASALSKIEVSMFDDMVGT
jgi:hypothetical protein